MNEKRIFLVHGWEGSPDNNWFPWLRHECEQRGATVVSPRMPNADKPALGEWLPHLVEAVGKCDVETFFVGHSLGCITILRYLEQLTPGQRAGGAVLVAGFSEPIGYDELSSFFSPSLDYERVKKAVGHVAVIQSDNDPYVPFERGEVMRSKLGATLTVLHSAGHVGDDDNFKQLPEARDALFVMMNL